MALGTPTLLDGTGASGFGSSITSASVSPTGGALVLVFASRIGGASATTSGCSSGFSITGAWAEAADIVDTSSPYRTCACWYAFAAATPGSGTATITHTGGSSDRTIHVIEITGADTTTPIAQAATDNNPEGTADSTPSVTLGSGPASDSVTFSALAFGSSETATVDAQHTSISLVSTGVSSNDVDCVVSYDATTPGATTTWSGLSNSTNEGHAFLTLEVSAAGGAPATRRVFIIN